jgi:hypothetical protein
LVYTGTELKNGKISPGAEGNIWTYKAGERMIAANTVQVLFTKYD